MLVFFAYKVIGYKVIGINHQRNTERTKACFQLPWAVWPKWKFFNFFNVTRIYGHLRQPMRGLRRAVRFAGLHPPTQNIFALNGPFIQSFIKIGRQVTEKSVPYRQTTDKRFHIFHLFLSFFTWFREHVRLRRKVHVPRRVLHQKDQEQ